MDAVFMPSGYMPNPLRKIRCQNCGEGWARVKDRFCPTCLEREAIELSMDDDSALSARDNYHLAH